MKQKKINYLVKLIAFIIFITVGSRVYAATNPYPKWQTIEGYTTIRCTYYAWQQVYNNTGIALPNWGNAKSWAKNAKKAGYSVGTTPRANSVFVDTTGKYGHVGWLIKPYEEDGISYGDFAWIGKEAGRAAGEAVESTGIHNGRIYIEPGYQYIYFDKKPSHTHKYGDWKTTTAATCEKDGKQTRKCSCGVKETKTIKATGHEYSTEWTIDKAATCEKDGSKSHHCKKCNGRKDITSIKATGHNYSKEWIVDKQPTCLESGSKAHICSNCESKKDVTEVTALGHNYEDYVVDVEATCTKEGEKSKYCTRCNNREDIIAIDATGHIYGDWIIKHKSTDYEQGIKQRECVKCQGKDIELLPRTYKRVVALIVLGSILIIFTILLIIADIKYKKKGKQ